MFNILLYKINKLIIIQKMQTVNNLLSNFDLFPAPITFKFKSASTITSLFSAIISLTIILPLIYFIVSDLLIVFNHERIQTNIKVSVNIILPSPSTTTIMITIIIIIYRVVH